MTIRGRETALFLFYPEIILDVCAEYFHNGVI